MMMKDSRITKCRVIKGKGYLNTVPVPQSTSGKFELVISDNGTDISVNINSKQFYPK